MISIGKRQQARVSLTLQGNGLRYLRNMLLKLHLLNPIVMGNLYVRCERKKGDQHHPILHLLCEPSINFGIGVCFKVIVYFEHHRPFSSLTFVALLEFRCRH